LISTVSYAVNCGISGDPIDVEDLALSAITGAITGSVGAVAGVVPGFAVAGSLLVGVTTFGITFCNNDGDLIKSLISGVFSGVTVGMCTYAATFIPTATDDTFSAMFSAYCNTLAAGAPTEMVNFAVQQGVQHSAEVFSSGTTKNGGSPVTPKGGILLCRANMMM
jgi:hypothetical protein